MTSNSKLHPDNETLERYLLNRLSDGELERVEEHLFVCENCQDELTAIDTYVRDLKAATRAVQRQPETDRAGFFGRLFAIPRPVLAGAFAAFLLVMILPLATDRPPHDTQAVVQLETYRGSTEPSDAQAQAGRTLQLRFTDSVAPVACHPCRIEVVDAYGSQVWSGLASRDTAGLFVNTTRPFASGLYWVRLYGSGSNQLREYALQLK